VLLELHQWVVIPFPKEFLEEIVNLELILHMVVDLEDLGVVRPMSKEHQVVMVVVELVLVLMLRVVLEAVELLLVVEQLLVIMVMTEVIELVVHTLDNTQAVVAVEQVVLEMAE
jgi:hypothetical protein